MSNCLWNGCSIIVFFKFNWFIYCRYSAYCNKYNAIVLCDQTSNSITVSVTSKIGAVKVTSIDSFNQSKVVYNSNPSAVTLTVSGLSPNTSYFVEVYNFAGQPFKAQRVTTLAENSGV